jgi:restriction system protein
VPVPSYETFMLPLLRLLADGADQPAPEVRRRLGDHSGLTDEDRQARLPSGQMTVLASRVG